MACKHWQGDARDAPPGAFSSDGLPCMAFSNYVNPWPETTHWPPRCSAPAGDGVLSCGLEPATSVRKFRVAWAMWRHVLHTGLSTGCRTALALAPSRRSCSSSGACRSASCFWSWSTMGPIAMIRLGGVFGLWAYGTAGAYRLCDYWGLQSRVPRRPCAL
jgi:hypothetical protein